MKKGAVLTEDKAKAVFPADSRFKVTSFKDTAETAPAAAKKTDA